MIAKAEDIDLLALDHVIERYNAETDPILLAEFAPIEAEMHRRIAACTLAENAEAGGLTNRMHRISSQGAKFLGLLGSSPKVQENFRAAFMLCDLGKTHPNFDPKIWNASCSPDCAACDMCNVHIELGMDILRDMLRGASPRLMNHPHIRLIIPALMMFHHERMNGSGPMGRCAEDMGLIVRVACIVEAFDGDTSFPLHGGDKRVHTTMEAIERILCLDEHQPYVGAFDKKLAESYASFQVWNADRREVSNLLDMPGDIDGPCPLTGASGAVH